MATVTVVMGAASYAFACSATAYMEPLSPNAGPRGSEVTVTGSSWASASGSSTTASDATVGAVEIRWGNETGPRLGTANGPEFSVKVVIPDAAPGYYLVVGVARDRDGDIVGRQSRTFRITATAPAATGTSTGGSTAPTDGSTAPTSSGSSAPIADPAEQSASPAATEGVGAAQAPTGSATTERSPASSAPSAAVVSTGPGSAPASPAAAEAAGRTPAAVGAVAPAFLGIPAAAGASAPPSAAGVTAAQVAPLGDPRTLWDGAGTDLHARARPSLISEVPPGATRTSPALGIALLGIGMVSLSVVALVAAVSRRRASAHSGRR